MPESSQHVNRGRRASYVTNLHMSFYESLDIGSYQIRLITFGEQWNDEPLECELELCSLVNPPGYVALSYCWGDETVRKKIVVNGVTVTVTQNLEEALQQLKLIGVTRVWADALCINQDNVQEKSSQIKLMKDIYSRAQRTYAWLGGSNNPEVAKALRSLRLSPLCSQTAANLVDSSKQTQNAELAPLLTTYSDDAVEPSITDKQWLEEALVLSNCEYWKRRWIIQEITAAAEVHFLCESELWSYDDLRHLVDQYFVILRSVSKPYSDRGWAVQGHFRRFGGAFYHLERIFALRYSFRRAEYAGLIDTLLATRHYLSKDDRDQIFAIIGICPDGPDLIPLPNYHQSCSAVSRDLSRELIRRNAAFDIILADHHSRLASPDLPTWSPNWLSKKLPDNIGYSTRDFLGVPRDLLALALLGSSDTLTVQGVVLGKVLCMTSSFDCSGSSGLSHSRDNQLVSRTPLAYYGNTTLHIMSAILQCWRTEDLRPSARHVNATKLLFMRWWFRNKLIGQKPSESTVYVGDSIFQWARENAAFEIGHASLEAWLTSVPLNYWRYRAAGHSRARETHGGRRHRAAVYIMLFTYAITLFTTIFGYFFQESPRAWDFWKTVTVIYAPALILLLLAMVIVVPTLRKTIKAELAFTAYPSRRLAVLDTGMLATVSSDTALGDKICFIVGCRTAAVLRECGRSSTTTQHQVFGRAFACLSKEDNQRLRAFVGRLEENEPSYERSIYQYQQEPWWEQFLLI